MGKLSKMTLGQAIGFVCINAIFGLLVFACCVVGMLCFREKRSG